MKHKEWTKEELDKELDRYFIEPYKDDIVKYDSLKRRYKKGLKPEQVRYISELLSGNDVFAIMPTGAGKSMCFQLAGLLTPGVVIVISPLVALIQDQTKSLKENGIPAVCIYNEYDEDEESDGESLYSVESEINESFGWKKRKTAYLEAAEGKVKFLYVTPERFRKAHFMVLLRHLQVNLLILDEVHCMSIWGHEFRHSYLEILRVIKTLPNRPVIGAFTATATKAVREDVVNLLGLKLPEDYFNNSGNTIRKEIKFCNHNLKATKREVLWALRNVHEIIHPGYKRKLIKILLEKSNDVSAFSPNINSVLEEVFNMSWDEKEEIINANRIDMEWEHKKEYLFTLLDGYDEESGIIFCRTLANINKVYSELRNIYGKDKVVKYTGPMEKADKNKSFHAFNSGSARIMVATNAFGMGIDKQNIRFVIHYNTPDSIENYYQEAGRAGRGYLDSSGNVIKYANCHLLYSWVFDKIPYEFYSENHRFKGYRHLYDYTRQCEMREYVRTKTLSVKSSDRLEKYIDSYFNCVDFTDIWKRELYSLYDCKENSFSGELEYIHKKRLHRYSLEKIKDKVSQALEALSRLEEMEHMSLEEELKMPPCLFVNRSMIAENIRKGIYSAGFDGTEPTLVSRKIKVDRNEIKEKYKEESDISIQKEKYKKEVERLTKENLRKGYRVSYRLSFRDEAGKVVSYDEIDDSKKLTYFDMMIADAVYTLMFYDKPICAKNIFAVLTGNHYVVLTKNKKEIIDSSIRKMMNTIIEIDPIYKANQGIPYESIHNQEERFCREQFLPLLEPKEGTKNGAFRTKTKEITINVPKGLKTGDTDIKIIVVKKKRKIVHIPALYRFAENLFQFYVFPVTALNMDGEDWILRKTPNYLEEYYKCIKSIPTWGWGKGILLGELLCIYLIYDRDCFITYNDEKQGTKKWVTDIPKRMDYTFENTILTHFLLRRIYSLHSLSNRIRIFDDSQKSIFESLFKGIRNIEGMDKYSKKRMIQNLLKEHKGIDGILDRMSYLGIIRDYSFENNYEVLSLKQSMRQLSTSGIRDKMAIEIVNHIMEEIEETNISLRDANDLKIKISKFFCEKPHLSYKIWFYMKDLYKLGFKSKYKYGAIGFLFDYHKRELSLEPSYTRVIEDIAAGIDVDNDMKFQVKIDDNRLKDFDGLYKGFYISAMPKIKEE